jgi:hypothetical protein
MIQYFDSGIWNDYLELIIDTPYLDNILSGNFLLVDDPTNSWNMVEFLTGYFNNEFTNNPEIWQWIEI